MGRDRACRFLFPNFSWSVFMNSFFLALGLAALIAFSNLIGGLVAEAFPPSKGKLSVGLHMAAGVLLAMITVKLIPNVLQPDRTWITLFGFIAGGTFFILSDRAVREIESRYNVDKRKRKPWLIFLSLTTNIFSGGIMIGVSMTIQQSLSIFITIARVIAHLAQGFVAIAEFQQGRIARRLRFLALLSFFFPVLLGTTVGYGLVQVFSIQLFQLSLLSFTTGTLITAVIEEIVPEAHEKADRPLDMLVFVVSFALFALFLSQVNV
jgi:ZIP family zinc transporter